MRNIDRRLESVEKKLGLKDEIRKTVIIVREYGTEHAVLPESVDDWITYKEKLKSGRQPLCVSASEEMKARARVTKRNKNSTK